MPAASSAHMSSDSVNRDRPITSAAHGAHLLLMVEEDLERCGRAREQLSRSLPAISIDSVHLSCLLRDKASAPRPLSHYLVVLVSSEATRKKLCEIIPSLNERVYTLDHFSAQDALTEPSNERRAHEACLNHWSICISQLLNAPLTCQLTPPMGRGAMKSRPSR